MEDEVVDPLEEAFATIEGVRHIHSEAGQGEARVTLEFELEHDLDTAAQDVRDKLNVTMRRLPRDIEPPSLGKADYSQFPIIIAPIASDLPATETTEYVEEHVKPALESIPGAAGVQLWGGRERNLRIWIDPGALRARGLAVSDVLGALRREHVDRPGGFIEGHAVEWAVKTDAEFRSVAELENMIVSWDGEAPIRMRDVARIEDGAEDVRDASYMNGKRGIALGLSKQSKGNTVAIVDELFRRMDEIRKSQPDGIQIAKSEGFLDNSQVIRESFEETMLALAFGGVLAVFVVFVFIRRFRPTMIVAAAIPLSIVATFGLIWVFGFTLNTMTLLGLTLAIGVVIDDAIIVLENIERHREGGKNALEAARSGTREITLAACAATFSVAAVFVPVAFASGPHGRVPARVRHHGGRRGDDLAVRGAHAHADARRAHAAAEGARPRQHLPPSRALVPRARDGLSQSARLDARAPRQDRRDRGGVDPGRDRRGQAAAGRVLPRLRLGLHPDQLPRAARHLARGDRGDPRPEPAMGARSARDRRGVRARRVGRVADERSQSGHDQHAARPARGARPQRAGDHARGARGAVADPGPGGLGRQPDGFEQPRLRGRDLRATRASRSSTSTRAR